MSNKPTDATELVSGAWAMEEIARLRGALTQIENWVGKGYRDMAEAEQIRDFIDKACEEGLGSR